VAIPWALPITCIAKGIQIISRHTVEYRQKLVKWMSFLYDICLRSARVPAPTTVPCVLPPSCIFLRESCSQNGRDGARAETNVELK
jgi:hypothetical protein